MYEINCFKKDQLLFIKCSSFCLLLGIFLLPFNCIERMPYWFGEFSIEAAFIPLAMCVLLMIFSFIRTHHVQIPEHISFKLFFCFLGWAILSGIINYGIIITSFTKGRGGLEKFILQYVVIVFSFVVSLVGYQVCVKLWKGKTLQYIKMAVLCSFLVTVAYSVIELFFFSGHIWARDFLIKLNSFYRVKLFLWNTLRTVCGEPSWFGSYFAFVYPWLLAGLFMSKRHKYWYLIIILYSWLMVYLTFSRTAYFTVMAETLLFIILILATKIYKVYKKPLYVLIFASVIFISIIRISFPVANVSKESPNQIVKGETSSISSVLRQPKPNLRKPKPDSRNLSNIARFGATVTAFRMGCDNPVFGVGLGQFTFHMPKYIPDWAWESTEIRNWASPSAEISKWAMVHCLFARIFAEEGIIGLLLWLSVYASIAFAISKRILQTKTDNYDEKLWLIMILVILAGVVAQGFNLDTFRYMEYPIIMFICWNCIDQSKKGFNN